MDIYTVRTKLAEAASTVVIGNGSVKLTCTPYTPDAVTEPMFFIADYEIDYDGTMRRGMDTIQFTARILVGHADEQSAQKLVDSMFSGSGVASLKVAIESKRNTSGGLDGECADYQVVRMQGNRWYDHGGVKYVGGEIIIKVIGSGG